MKKHIQILGLTAVLLSYAFTTDNACQYAGSNIGYVNAETQKAIDAEEINLARYYTYKALNAIEKSKDQLNACACDYANQSIYEGLEQLKLAARSPDLATTKKLLKKALDNIQGGLDALEEHQLHDSKYANDVLSMGTKEAQALQIEMEQPVGPELRKKIDQTLVKFQNSVAIAINSVECSEVRAFITNTYRVCEQELLREDITEAKRYFNLRTKEIIADALTQLEDCTASE